MHAIQSPRRRDLLRAVCGLAVAAVLSGTPHASKAAETETSRSEAASTQTRLSHDPATGSLLRNAQGRLERSSDGGATWQAIGDQAPAGTASAVAFEASASADALYLAGPGIGVARSDDDGRTWTSLNDGLPSSDVTAFATHSTQPYTLYAHIEGEGVHRTQDGGETWRLMDKRLDGVAQLIHSHMEGSMDSGWLYAGTADGLRVSMDCFCFWRAAGGVEGPVQAVAHDPDRPERVYAVAGQHLARSADGGRTWERIPLPGTASAVAVDASGVVYAAGGLDLHRSADQGDTWERVGG